MTDIKKRRIPHNVRGGAIYELVHMYKSPFAWVRETIANIYDQAKHPDVNGRKPIARIYVSKLRREINIIDDMTGVRDLDDFTAVGTEKADRSSGKIVGDRISSYDHIDSEIAGQKHVGKLSCMAACIDGKESTEYYSNNGRNGHYLHMDCDGWEPFEHDLPFQIIDRVDALPHMGLKIVITDVRDECLNINRMQKEISRYFAILLSKKKIQIFIYDMDRDNREIEVHKPEGFETKGEDTHRLLEMSKGGNIRVNLKPLDAPSLSSNIDVYSKEIYVFSKKVPHLVKGYENWDGHELVITRDDVKDNPEYIEKSALYYATEWPPEWRPDPKRQMGEKQKETIVKVIEEVCTAISKVHPELLVDLFGYATPFGLAGKILNNPRRPFKKPDDWITRTITYDPNGTKPIIPGGEGTTGGGGGGKPPIGTEDNGGEYTGKVLKEPEPPATEPDKPKLVMPQIDVMDGPFGDIPTLSARVIPEENRLEVVINASKPASSIIRKSGSIERYREVCYDKFISAIIKLKYDSNDLEQFEKKKEEIWNALYQEGNGIQEQTEQMMMSTSKARRDSAKAGRK